MDGKVDDEKGEHWDDEDAVVDDEYDDEHGDEHDEVLTLNH